MWALDQLYQEVGVYIDADPDTYLAKDSDGNYVDTISFGKVRSALNRAKNKLSQRYSSFQSEDFTLNSTLLIDTASLVKQFQRVKSITSNGYDQNWDWAPDNKISLPYNSSGDIVTLEYYYAPIDLLALTDTLDFPETVIDPRIPCYYAAYLYFLEDGNSRKANFWLAQWNDGLEEIRTSRGEIRRIKDVY